jgi:hypothetical protein
VATGTSSAQQTLIIAAIANSITAFLLTIPIAGTFYYTRLLQIIYDASPLILDVTAALVDGSTDDFTAAALEVVTFNTADLDITFAFIG